MARVLGSTFEPCEIADVYRVIIRPPGAMAYAPILLATDSACAVPQTELHATPCDGIWHIGRTQPHDPSAGVLRVSRALQLRAMNIFTAVRREGPS